MYSIYFVYITGIVYVGLCVICSYYIPNFTMLLIVQTCACVNLLSVYYFLIDFPLDSSYGLSVS